MNENMVITAIYQKSPHFPRFFFEISIIFIKYPRLIRSMNIMVSIAKVMFGFSRVFISRNTPKIISAIVTIAKAKKSSNFNSEKILNKIRPPIFSPKIQNPNMNKKSIKEIDVNIMLSIVHYIFFYFL